MIELKPLLKGNKNKITEMSNKMTYNGIVFTVILRINDRWEGYVQLIPTSSKEIDKLNDRGKESVIKFLTVGLKQKLGFPVTHVNDGSAGLKFKFNSWEIEDILIKKII